MIDDASLSEAAALLAALQARGITLATAESCTGGLIAAALTAIPGSSATVLAGFVTYSNAAKTSMLGVPEALLAQVGAVSEEVARHMATAALARSGAGIALSCTGIAGPGGGSAGKPVGLVHLCVTSADHVLPLRVQLGGDRAAVRARTVVVALHLVRELLDRP